MGNIFTEYDLFLIIINNLLILNKDIVKISLQLTN